MSSSTRNSITSDGVAISFLFARPKRPEVESQKWSSLDLNLENDRLWGVDPGGGTDIFVASDSNQGKHEIRCTSTKEYYRMCAYNRSNQKIKTWKDQNESLKVIERNMPSAKTSNLSTFDNYVQYLHVHHRTIVLHYNSRFNKENFKRYTKKQQAVSEICRRLTTGQHS